MTLRAKLCSTRLLNIRSPTNLFKHLYLTSFLRGRFHTLPPPSHPVSNLEDIKERCLTVFKSPAFRIIAWAGVFGSFSDGTQTAESDIDLLIGFKQGTSRDEVYYMEDLQEQLLIATRSNVDILYIYDNQPPSFIKAHALLTGKTIYEVDAWLRHNRPIAERLIKDTHRRLSTVLQLANGISQQAATSTQENTATLEELIQSVATLTHVISPKDPDSKCFDCYFSPVYSWTSVTLRLTLQYEENGIGSINTDDRKLLLRDLTNDLPEHMRVLKNLYMPVLEDAWNELAFKVDDEGYCMHFCRYVHYPPLSADLSEVAVISCNN